MTESDGWNNWIGSETETTSLAVNDGGMSSTEGLCGCVQLTVTLMTVGAIGTIESCLSLSALRHAFGTRWSVSVALVAYVFPCYYLQGQKF